PGVAVIVSLMFAVRAFFNFGDKRIRPDGRAYLAAVLLGRQTPGRTWMEAYLQVFDWVFAIDPDQALWPVRPRTVWRVAWLTGLVLAVVCLLFRSRLDAEFWHDQFGGELGLWLPVVIYAVAILVDI